MCFLCLKVKPNPVRGEGFAKIHYDSPSPKLGGRAARELRWLGETQNDLQGRTRGEQKQLDLDSAALFVEEAVANE